MRRVTRTFYIDEKINDRLRTAAYRGGVEISDIVDRALSDFFERLPQSEEWFPDRLQEQTVILRRRLADRERDVRVLRDRIDHLCDVFGLNHAAAMTNLV